MSAFGYIDVKLTDASSDMLRSNKNWVFFNFLDFVCDDVLNNNPDSLIYDE